MVRSTPGMPSLHKLNGDLRSFLKTINQDCEGWVDFILSVIYDLWLNGRFTIGYTFKRLAYTLTAYCCDATECFVKALPMGQNIVLDKSYTIQFGQISILEHCKWQLLFS